MQVAHPIKQPFGLILFFLVLRWAFGIAMMLLLGVISVNFRIFYHPEQFLIPLMVFWTFWCVFDLLRGLARVLLGK